MPKLILIIIVVGILVTVGYVVNPKSHKLPEFKSVREEAFAKYAKKINNVKDVEFILPIPVSATAVNAGRDPKIPKTVSSEFIYKGAVLVNLEQYASRGVVFVAITPDAPDVVAATMLKQVKDAGWEVYEGGDRDFSIKKDSQKANVKVEKDDQTVLVVALIFKH